MKWMPLEQVIDTLLDTMDLEEILEQNDLEPRDVLEILVRGGYIDVPDWTEAPEYEDDDELR